MLKETSLVNTPIPTPLIERSNHLFQKLLSEARDNSYGNPIYENMIKTLHTTVLFDDVSVFKDLLSQLKMINPHYATHAISFFAYDLPDVLAEINETETEVLYTEEFTTLDFFNELKIQYPYKHQPSQFPFNSAPFAVAQELGILLCLTRNYIRRLILPETPKIFLGFETDIDEFTAELHSLAASYNEATGNDFSQTTADDIINAIIQFGIHDPFPQRDTIKD